VDVDHLTMPIQLHRGRIDAGIQPPADQLAGNLVERLGDLHMPIRRGRASAARRAKAPI
jgi:hypothetical protein